MVRSDTARSDLVWSGEALGTVRLGMVWFAAARFVAVGYTGARFGRVRLVEWCGLAGKALARSG
jgi:hypothetical protein